MIASVFHKLCPPTKTILQLICFTPHLFKFYLWTSEISPIVNSDSTINLSTQQSILISSCFYVPFHHIIFMGDKCVFLICLISVWPIVHPSCIFSIHACSCLCQVRKSLINILQQGSQTYGPLAGTSLITFLIYSTKVILNLCFKLKLSWKLKYSKQGPVSVCPFTSANDNVLMISKL